MMFKICIYKYNSPVTFSRRLITLLMDFMIIIFMTIFGFLACETLLSKMTELRYNQQVVQAREIREELTKMIAESRLGYAVDGTIVDLGKMSEDYIKNLCKNSLGESEKSYEEPLFYYYGSFKENHAEKFSKDLGNTGIQYIYGRMLECVSDDTEQYFVKQGVTAIPQLEKPAAIALQAWLEDEEETTEIAGVVYDGAKIAEDLTKMYKELMREAREEFTLNYEDYSKKYEHLNQLQTQMIEAKIVQLLLVYLVVMTIYYLVVPSLLKNGTSLSNKLFHMVGCMKNGYEVTFWSVLLKWIMKMLGYFSIVYLVLILLYNINSKAFMDYRVFGIVKFSNFYFVSLGVMLLSVGCCASDKAKYRTLSDFVSGQEMKDLRS